VKFYILVHRKLEYLKNHAATIPFKDQVVVINSLNNDFVDQASAYCQENSIEYYVTESDGTPATGKNSVMKLFLESDNEYMVQVDGDDEITPYGYDLYKSISRSKNPPDIVCLKNQLTRKIRRYFFDKDNDELKVQQTWKVTAWVRPRKIDDNESFKQHLEHMLQNKKNLTKEQKQKHVEWATERSIFETFCWDFGNGDSEQRETFTRMVFYSRKAAELIRFDNTLTIGEDLVEFLRLKCLCKKGNLTMVVHNEIPNPKKIDSRFEENYSYLHRNLDFDSIVSSNYDVLTETLSFDWIAILLDYIEEHNLKNKYESIKDWHLPEMNRPDAVNIDNYEYKVKWS